MRPVLNWKLRGLIIFLSLMMALPILVRIFCLELFYIPSGSMLPTLFIGDVVLVNKLAYGLRIPSSPWWIYQNAGPQYGDIIVFKFPPEPKTNYIKRVVGVPGDRLQVKGGVIYRNGVAQICQQKTETLQSEISLLQRALAETKTEDYCKISVEDQAYWTLFRQNTSSHHDQTEILIPNHQYFVMGDNRDSSSDSRVWGFVPQNNLVGKATRIVYSVNTVKGNFYYDRFFKLVR